MRRKFAVTASRWLETFPVNFSFFSQPFYIFLWLHALLYILHFYMKWTHWGYIWKCTCVCVCMRDAQRRECIASKLALESSHSIVFETIRTYCQYWSYWQTCLLIRVQCICNMAQKYRDPIEMINKIIWWICFGI